VVFTFSGGATAVLSVGAAFVLSVPPPGTMVLLPGVRVWEWRPVPSNKTKLSENRFFMNDGINKLVYLATKNKIPTVNKM
jgi:hypothetical protein